MVAKLKISLPHKFEPRPYQIPIFEAIENGIKRGVCVWHRRSGKDKSLWNLMLAESALRIGNYYYYFPTMSQGRKTIWQGKDKEGFAFLDHVPKELIKRKSDQEMRIEFYNGSAVQIVGTDRLEVVGPNPIGCIFSEYSLQDPNGWEYIRPILVENEGWAIFNYTPRGMNHGFDMYDQAKNNDDWFCELLTVDDTQIISKAAIKKEADAGMAEGLVQQEFYCSFQYGLKGAYYLDEMAKLRKQGQIGEVPAQDIQTHTAWDIGEDQTSIWFIQIVGQKINIIDYHQDTGKGLPHYARVLQEKGYLYGTHLAPHDMENREWGSGESRIDKASKLKIDFEVVPRDRSIDDGIGAVRSLIMRCWFDENQTKKGLHALMNYQREWDEKNKTFNPNPKPRHWANHGADAFRTFASGFNLIESEIPKVKINTQMPHVYQHAQGWMA